MAFITKTNLGRLMTEEERATRDTKLAEAISAGVTDGTFVVGDEPWIYDRPWTTLEAANEWITFMEGLTPPPVSAAVVEV